MSAMTDAVTSAPDPAATSATPRPRRTWDLILTIVLLIALVDDLVLEWKGARVPKAPAQALRNE